MLSTAWLSASAPVGVLQAGNEWTAFGACVFFLKPPMLWTVTAKHLVEKVGKTTLTVLVTRSSGEGFVVVEVGKILTANGLSWVLDEENDLAAAPMPASPEFGLKGVTVENCFSLSQLLPSMLCFTVGCPYGLHGLNMQTATPLVLGGVISGLDPTSRRVYTGAPTFPGNSGGPLIAVGFPFTPGGGVTVGQPPVSFAGIMLQSRLVSGSDPNNRIPPLHLGVAAPADAVLALLDSDQAKAIAARVAVIRSVQDP